MSPLGRVLSFFPAAVVVLALLTVVWFAGHPGPAPIAAGLFVLYGFPLLVFRVHDRAFRLEPGASYLGGRSYNPWWGAHQIQLVYLAFPQLEAALRLVPGAYSAWLRLWGSRVGRGVHWTPLVDISDRSLLVVGDRVIFGHRSGVFAHIIKPTRGNFLLYLKPVTIEDDAFIGAGANLGPGVCVRAGVMVPATTVVLPNKEVT